MYGELRFSLSKVNNCVQFRAFINESLRIARTAPHGVFRTWNKDIRCLKFQDKNNKKDEIICKECDSPIWSKYNNNKASNIDIIYDYIIPKNTIISPNVQYMSIDKNVWDLDTHGSELNLNYWLKYDEIKNKYIFVNNKNNVPFGVGTRDCAGQSLAMKQLYAFFGNIILRYKIMESPAHNYNNLSKLKDIDGNGIPIVCTLNEGTSHVKPQIPVIICKRYKNEINKSI